VRKLKIVFPAVVFIGLLSVVSCSKSNNNNSSSGKDSVFYSPWLTISMSATDAGDTAFTETISASRVTASIVSGGAVMTYLGEPGFPSTGDTAAESAVDFGLYTTLVPGSIELASFGLNNDFTTSNSGLLFRYVVIPGTVLATTSLHNYTRQQLEKMSFKDIQNAINTPVQGTSSGISTAKPATP
jgi:hypothetical protein